MPRAAAAQIVLLVSAFISFLLWSAVVGLVTTHGLPYRRFVLYRTVRKLREYDSLKAAFDTLEGDKSTVTSYKKYIKKLKGKEPERIDDLALGAKLLWLGPTNPDKVIYYFHGGAYVGAAVSGHFAVLHDVVEEAKKKGLSVSAAFLAYDLAPKGKYPVQLQQAVSGLRHLVEELHIPPANIIISGDSAGGNLALALFSQIMHPQANVTTPFADGHQHSFRGVLLVSPWVTFTYNSPSVRANCQRDFVSVYGLEQAASEFLGGQKYDNYTTPLLADAKWWNGLPASSIGVLAGTYEIFLQDIRDIFQRIKVHNPSATYVELKKEVHDQAVLDKTLGFKESDSERVFRNWMLQVLEG